MTEIKAIDMMNYPPQVKEEVNYNFNDYPEWIHLAKTTFKPMLPMGRFPTTEEELAQHKYLYGTMFYPYETVADLVKAMDELGYDKICMAAVKMWSLKTHSFVWDFSVDLVNRLV
ncbi:MAG: hypothetical protein P8182_08105, partial [Deltaproteobacteria bacterium]